MKSRANNEILDALKQVVGATLKTWLDENRAEVLQAVGAALAARHTPAPPPPPPVKQPEEKREPQFCGGNPT